MLQYCTTDNTLIMKSRSLKYFPVIPQFNITAIITINSTTGARYERDTPLLVYILNA